MPIRQAVHPQTCRLSPGTALILGRGVCSWLASGISVVSLLPAPHSSSHSALVFSATSSGLAGWRLGKQLWFNSGIF